MAQSALKVHIPLLKQHRSRLQGSSIQSLFDSNGKRAEQFCIEDNSLLFDYSKNRIDEEALSQLVKLAREAGLESARRRMFEGEKINFTEERAVLHTALRSARGDAIIVDGADIMPEIDQTKQRAFAFAQDVRSAKYRLSGGRVSDVVNIGIGGSDLGPVMCVAALAPFCSGPKVHFVSNVDGADFHDTTSGLNPSTTLFIIASKTFTTAETMANAKLARKWLAQKVSRDKIGQHFAALSTNLEATATFGIDEARTFGFWNWVGGRYSIWSAIGLSLMIAIGAQNYQEFLDGAGAADRHFLDRDFDSNIPVVMALLGIWHRNVWDYPAHAVLPYDNRLLRFPAYLQQLDMESNGKHICFDGNSSQYSTGPLIWGEPGTNGQHAFYQLLHQGTDIIPCDFLVAAKSHESDQAHQMMLVANCLAQSEAMMVGRSAGEVICELKEKSGQNEVNSKLAPHKVFEGNRPSNTFLYQQLTPHMLGRLIAFYEHKIFVQGVIWGINSFDQWGVELGKQLATQINPLLEHEGVDKADTKRNGSTLHLVEKFHHLKN